MSSSLSPLERRFDRRFAAFLDETFPRSSNASVGGGSQTTRAPSTGSPIPIRVAWSGGPDSTALLLLTLGFEHRFPERVLVGALHVRHVGFPGSRPDVARRHVVDLAARWRVPLQVVDALPRSSNTATDATGPARTCRPTTRRTPSAYRAIEETARDLRYQAIARVARLQGDRVILAGHTRDDQLETLLFRLHRGTGVRGIAGIPVTRPLEADFSPGKVVSEPTSPPPTPLLHRPLLRESRIDLTAWLQGLGVPVHGDPANHDPRHARTRVRDRWLPSIRLTGGGTLLCALTDLSDEAAALRKHTDAELAPVLRAAQLDRAEDGSFVRVSLDRSRLRGLSPIAGRTVLYEMIQAMAGASGLTRRHLREADRLVRESASGKRAHLPGGIVLRVDRESVVLVRSLHRIRTKCSSRDIEADPLGRADSGGDPHTCIRP